MYLDALSGTTILCKSLAKKTKNLSLRMVKYNHIHGASILSTTLKRLLILCKFQHSSLRTILKTDIV